MNETEDVQVGFRKVHYSLHRWEDNDQPKFRWQTDNMIALSPIFSSEHQAEYYRRTNPMLTDAEWLERPLPEDRNSAHETFQITP